MRILKVSLAIVALAAPVASARAEEAAAAAPPAVAAAPAGQGWTDTWALLFNLSLSDSLLREFQGIGIGGQYYLGPDMAVRFTLGYSRDSTPRGMVENVSETDGTRVVTYSLDDPSSYTSRQNLSFVADFLYRLTLNNVAPYTGGGLWVSTSRYNNNYTDDASVVNQITTQKGYDRTTAFGVRGLLGAEWKLHPSFALFAEYELNVTLAKQHSALYDVVTEVTIDGVRTVRHTSQKMSVKSSFQTEVGSGGRVGVAVNF